jgi:hypothetical protein
VVGKYVYGVHTCLQPSQARTGLKRTRRLHARPDCKRVQETITAIVQNYRYGSALPFRKYKGMSNGGSGMLLPHVSTNLKRKWSNRCEKYWSNPWHFLSSLKAALVSLFPSHLFTSLFTFCVEEAASCRRDRLSKSISSKPKLDHSNLAKAARQHPWGYALYMP